MLKFFRRIRKSLIDSGSPQKYMLYAVGEILLVVVGILIALQINNWNENRKSKEKELGILQEIISDLETNIASLENTFNPKITIGSLLAIQDHLMSENSYHDSLGGHFSNGTAYFKVDFKISGYESLKSIGLDLIEDNSLRSEIGHHFSFWIPQFGNTFEEVREDFYNYMLPHILNDFIMQRQGHLVVFVPRDYEKLRSNGIFLEKIKMYLIVNQDYDYVFAETLNEAKKLRQEILQYIEKQ